MSLTFRKYGGVLALIGGLITFITEILFYNVMHYHNSFSQLIMYGILAFLPIVGGVLILIVRNVAGTIVTLASCAFILLTDFNDLLYAVEFDYGLDAKMLAISMVGAWIVLIGGIMGIIDGKWANLLEKDKIFNEIFKVFISMGLVSILSWTITFVLLPKIHLVSLIILTPIFIVFIVICMRARRHYGEIATTSYNVKFIYYALTLLALSMCVIYYWFIPFEYSKGFSEYFAFNCLIFLAMILFVQGMGFFFLFFGKASDLRARDI